MQKMNTGINCGNHHILHLIFCFCFDDEQIIMNGLEMCDSVSLLMCLWEGSFNAKWCKPGHEPFQELSEFDKNLPSVYNQIG